VLKFPRRTTAVIGALAVTAAGAVTALAVPTQAQAAVVGTAVVVPATGTATTPQNLTSSGPCASPAVKVRGKAFGFGFPVAGVNLYNVSTLAYSTEAPMVLAVNNIWQVYGEMNSTHLAGDYDVRVQCTNNSGTVVYDEYQVTLTWTTPGNSVANLGSATYVTKAANAATTTTLAISLPSPQAQGTPLTLIATVDAGSTDPGAGTVEFRDGSASLGTAPVVNGVATRTGVVLPVGTRSLTAVYSGTAGYSGSTSIGTPFVVNAAPVTTFTSIKAPTVAGTVQVGKKLTADAGTWSPAPTTATFQWLRNGAPIAKATSSSYTAVAPDKGKRISVRVTVARAGVMTTNRTSAATTVVKAGKFSATKKPTVKGKAKVGKKLSATPGTWTPRATTYTYQWLRSGKVIKKATKSTYKLTKKDRKKKVSVRVTARAAGYDNASAASAAKKVK
jgi:hypothetical protein